MLGIVFQNENKAFQAAGLSAGKKPKKKKLKLFLGCKIKMQHI